MPIEGLPSVPSPVNLPEPSPSQGQENVDLSIHSYKFSSGAIGDIKVKQDAQDPTHLNVTVSKTTKASAEEVFSVIHDHFSTCTSVTLHEGGKTFTCSDLQSFLGPGGTQQPDITTLVQPLIGPGGTKQPDITTLVQPLIGPGGTKQPDPTTLVQPFSTLDKDAVKDPIMGTGDDGDEE